ncbi:ras gtpase-activating protein 1-like protein [Lasius niger]|uniref:Ras gtpase-activating protein 1-like protein n=2 Tax=Lasius TaxID=488720 RepID=A0A0J7KM65_LASNI|nr:ras gtpase-activating protein 1-like protein [Lasius niger]
MAEFVRGGPSVSNNAKMEHSSKGGSPSTGSEDGGQNESLNAENEFDPFLENIPDDIQDTEEPDGANATLLTAPPENQ